MAVVTAAPHRKWPCSHAERAEIAREVEKMREEQPESLRSEMERALLKGIAPHHAGCLPGWKSLVERLFQRGLLKLVFATDTLAAGINMPARTTGGDAIGGWRLLGSAS